MAKTNFNDGSWLTPTFMDAFFGTDAVTGHNHDGLDADGSCPKVVTDDLEDFTDTFQVKIRASDVFGGAPSAKTWTYRKSGNLITLIIPESVELSDSSYCQIEAFSPADFPSDIIPTTSQKIPAIVVNAQSYTTILSPGLIEIPSAITSNMILWCMDPIESSTNILQAQDFDASNIVYKGLVAQSITYWID